MMKTLKLYIALAGIFLTVRLLGTPIVTDVSDPVNTIGPLTLSPVAALRVSGLALPFTAVPSTLLGNTLISVSRGDPALPGHGYSFHVHQRSTLYLFVMNRGTPTPPAGWQLATGLQTSFSGYITFHDTVYTKTTSSDETVLIPEHDGTDGSSYGVPSSCVIVPVVTNVSDPVNTIGPLTVGAPRVANVALQFTSLPPILSGKTFVSVSRGDLTIPGHSYTFHVNKSSILYLLVMQRGTPTPTPPTGWQLATGLTTSWTGGYTTFHDTVYTRTTSNDETVTIPVHNGTDGSSYGVPDCCVIDDEGIMSMQDLMNPAINEVTFGAAPVHSPLTLISNSIPLVTIVIPTGASAGVQSAATDLTNGIYLVTGVNVVTKHEGESISGLFIKIDDRTYTGYEQGFQTTTSAQGITIIGDSKGVQNGVCDFQERILGIRWYYPGDDGTVYKTKGQLVVPPFTYSDYPRNIKREMWPWGAGRMIPGNYNLNVGELGSDPIFKSAMVHFRSACGSAPVVDCHVFPNFGMHYSQYPTCFEQRTDGSRNSGIPCYGRVSGTPSTLQLHVDALSNFFTSGDQSMWYVSPGVYRGLPVGNRIAFSPPDNAITCKCPLCQAMVNTNGTVYYGTHQTGEYSKVVGNFAANLAHQIKLNWPDKIMTYLPYWNYVEPPQGVDFSDNNVYVMVCLMYGVGMSKDPAIRAMYTNWINGWHNISHHPVSQWEYICWPGNHYLPIVCLHTVKGLKQLTEGNTSGSFINGSSAGATDLPGGTWAVGHIVIYGLFRTLWNADYNVDAMFNEYLSSMYGDACYPMGQAIKLLQDRWEKTALSQRLDFFSAKDVVDNAIHNETMPWAEAQKLSGYLADARALAGTSGLIRRRVDFFGRGIDAFIESSAIYHGQKQFTPPTLHVRWVPTLPVCDGNIDTDAVWQAAAAPSPFVKAYISYATTPDNPSSVQAVWNSTGITFAFKASDEYMDKLHAPSSGFTFSIWNEDTFNLFLMDNDQRFVHCIANANTNTAWSGAECTVSPWAAVHNLQYTGTVCAATQAANGWNVEMFIPFSAFLAPQPQPAPGTQWKANFVRNRSTAGDSSRQRWSTHYVKNPDYIKENSDYDSMGTLIFE